MTPLRYRLRQPRCNAPAIQGSPSERSTVRPIHKAWVAAGLLSLACVACQSKPKSEPNRGPALQAHVQTEYYFGAPLAGPSAQSGRSALPGQPWTFAIEAHGWAQTGASTGTSPGSALVEQAALLIDPRQAHPILASTRHLANARWWAPASFAPASQEPNQKVFADEVALLPGQTYALTLQPNGASTAWCLSIHRSVGASRGFDMTLTVIENGEAVEIMQWDEVWQTDSGDRAIGLRQGAEHQPGDALVVTVRPWNANPDGVQKALARGAGQGVQSHPRPVALPSGIEQQSRFLQAELDRLRATQKRSVLLSLATELRALRAQDWILICTPEDLSANIADLGKGTGRLALADQPERLALRLEVLALGRAAQNVAERNHPQSQAYLIRQAGQLGMAPDVLLEVLDLSTSVADLDARIAAENRIFLEDSDRAARLRAFEWLKTRGQEPRGYDPLSRSSRRQQALQRWREQLDQQTANEAAPEAALPTGADEESESDRIPTTGSPQ